MVGLLSLLGWKFFPGRGPRPGVERAIDEGVETPDLPAAGEGHEFDAARVSRLETHGGARWDVEAEAPGRRSPRR